MKSKNIIRIVICTALILLIPLVSMQFSDEVDWKLPDFIIIGVLVIAVGLAYEMSVKKVSNTKHRVAIGLVLAAALLLIWTEFAVGLFGTPLAGS